MPGLRVVNPLRPASRTERPCSGSPKPPERSCDSAEGRSCRRARESSKSARVSRRERKTSARGASSTCGCPSTTTGPYARRTTVPESAWCARLRGVGRGSQVRDRCFEITATAKLRCWAISTLNSWQAPQLAPGRWRERGLDRPPLRFHCPLSGIRRSAQLVSVFRVFRDGGGFPTGRELRYSVDIIEKYV